MRKRVIAVIGSGVEEDAELLSRARQVGRLIAENGYVLITGGLGGIMEAASAGANDGAGIVIGILPDEGSEGANQYVGIAIATGLREARNAIMATAAEALIAVSGEYGTLSEIALALKLGKPVITLCSPWDQIPGTIHANTPKEAIERVKDILN